MINHMVITRNLGIYVQIDEIAQRIVEGIVDEFCLIFSSIKAVSLLLGRGIAK